MLKRYLLIWLTIPFFAAGQIVTITSTITPDLSDYSEPINYPGTGEYQIFLDTNNGVLDKPIILIDGFDPGDGRDITALYDLLTFDGLVMGFDNLADYVRSEGFDLIIFNSPVYTRSDDMAIIDGGADFIERNAMLLVDIINTVNADKVGNEKNVIIGPSMGGLISRYALNYMENNDIDHETRVWISFDSPHLGANIPIGMQHQFNFLANGLGDNSVDDLQPLIDAQLNSPAARQMLIDHFESHLTDGSDTEFDPTKLLPDPHPWRDAFMQNMNELTSSGFPEGDDVANEIRNVSIINGSGIGTPYKDKMDNDISPGFNLIQDTFDVAPFTTAELAVNFTPSMGTTALVSKVKVVFDLVIPITLYDENANSEAFGFSHGVDAAPGGLFDIGGLTDDLPLTGLTADFVNALTTDFFNFIPSVSAMALENDGDIDWFHTFDLGDPELPNSSPETVSNNTPFVNWYMPDDNEPHVTVTQGNVLFALSEIMPETLSISPEEIANIQLERNPVNDKLVLISSTPIYNMMVDIYDISGKRVFTTTGINLIGRTSIPFNLSSGFYILNARTNSNFTFRTKFIKK